MEIKFFRITVQTPTRVITSVIASKANNPKKQLLRILPKDRKLVRFKRITKAEATKQLKKSSKRFSLLKRTKILSGIKVSDRKR